MNIHYFCDLQTRVQLETAEISITVCLNVGQIFDVDVILSDARNPCVMQGFSFFIFSPKTT